MFFHSTYLYEATNQQRGRRHVQHADREPEPGGGDREGRSTGTFENSDAETKTETEQAFLASFIAHGRQPRRSC